MEKIYYEINYENEIEKARNTESKYFSIDSLIQNLMWLRFQKIPLLIRDNWKQDWVYHFFYNSQYHKLNAVSMKVKYNYSDDWFYFKNKDKLLNVLSNKEENDLNLYLENNTDIVVDLSEPIYKSSTENQISYVNSLLHKHNYGIQIEVIDQKKCNIIIRALKMDKNVIILYKGKQYTKQNILPKVVENNNEGEIKKRVIDVYNKIVERRLKKTKEL